MSALLSGTPKPLQNAIEHIQNDSRYRFYPLYSVLLMWIINVSWNWPFTDKLIIIYREYPWIIDFTRIAENSVLALSLLLGLVGLFRRGLLSKVLSGYAIYYAGPMLLWNLSYDVWWELSGLWADFTWYAFDIPIAWIHQHVGSDAFARTSLYAVYLFALYL
ncbi:MAG: hypothetical protein ABIA59_01830, partial [Candidatus Latescibacterota bacterium]